MPRYRWILKEKKWIEIDEIKPDPNAGLNGPVYCPEGGYFDRALQKFFHTKEEKRAYMREKGLKMDGSSKEYKGVQARGIGHTSYFYR